jgi:hypothetical protein
MNNLNFPSPCWNNVFKVLNDSGNLSEIGHLPIWAQQILSASTWYCIVAFHKSRVTCSTYT